MNKNTIIENGIYSIFLKERRRLYLDGLDYNNKDNYNHDVFDTETLIICFRIYEANHKRKTYGLNEILKWYYCIENVPYFKNHKLVFGTLTFNDSTLDRTSKVTRRRYVARYLKKYCIKYIANIDYGDKNEREHYHFIAMIEKDIPKNSWKYGIENLQHINTTIKDIKKIRSYLLKLNNHSYKNSTRNERVIMDKSSSKIDIIEVIMSEHPRGFKRFKLMLLDTNEID